MKAAGLRVATLLAAVIGWSVTVLLPGWDIVNAFRSRGRQQCAAVILARTSWRSRFRLRWRPARESKRRRPVLCFPARTWGRPTASRCHCRDSRPDRNRRRLDLGRGRERPRRPRSWRSRPEQVTVTSSVGDSADTDRRRPCRPRSTATRSLKLPLTDPQRAGLRQLPAGRDHRRPATAMRPSTACRAARSTSRSTA